MQGDWLRGQAARTAETLQGLGVGQRAWFWFCPTMQATPTALLMAPLQGKVTPTAIEARAARLPIPQGALRCVGIAAVAEDGALELASSLASEEVLTALAEWVQQYVPHHPALARLGGARMIAVDRDGIIVDRFADSSLWTGMVRPPSPGDPAATLAALPREGAAWLWGDVQGRARLVLVAEDPDGHALVQQVRGQAGVSGLLRRSLDGALAFISRAPLEDTEAMLLAVAARPGLSALAGARRVQTGQGRILAQRAGADPALAEALSALEVGEKVGFWLGDGELLLGVSREALQAAVQGRRPQKMARGVARLSGKGWVEFRTKQEYPGFIRDVAQWSGAALSRTPSVRLLRGARMTRRDDADTVLDRQRDDAAWAAVEA